MEFLNFLLFKHSLPQTLFVLSLVIASGVALGDVKMGGIRFGVSGVLFAGLLFGHFQFSVNAELLELIQNFGLILFVYTVGLHVGPGFFIALKKNGLKLNFLAMLVVLAGFLITIGFIVSGIVPTAAAVGLFSGATTNTPSLGAAQEALRVMADADAPSQNLPGLAYAMAYPFGIVGVILSMIFIKMIFRIRPQEELRRLEAEMDSHAKAITYVDLRVENANVNGLKIKDLPLVKTSGVVISRVMHNREVQIARPDTVLSLGDIIHGVGTEEQLRDLQLLIGSKSDLDLKKDFKSHLTARRIQLTRSEMVGKTVKEISLSGFYDIVVTRILRADIEFTPSPDIELQMADSILVVGEESSINKLASTLGDSLEELRKPHLIPVFIGIGTGVFLGSLPVYLPGVPVPVKLGMAGGPLLAAICFSRINHIGRLFWFMTRSAKLMLLELGIALFLASVGLRCGGQFLKTIQDGNGLLWMGLASVITLVPMLLAALVARWGMKMNYMALCGFLAGSMTDPPALAFANSQGKTSVTSLAYATVYPLVMVARIIVAQLIVIYWS